MKTVLVSLIILFLTGCTSLQYAGNASYSIKPYEDKHGSVHCCVVDVYNGKEIAYIKTHVSLGANGEIVVDLEESGVAAFQGQAIASQTAAATASTIATTVGAVMIAPVAAPIANTIINGIVP